SMCGAQCGTMGRPPSTLHVTISMRKSTRKYLKLPRSSPAVGTETRNSGWCAISLARVPLDWFARNRVRLIENFPPNSPDLNAIEYVWGWMKHHIASCEPHDRRSLEAAIRDAWDALTQTTIQHFINHVNSVMAEIIAAEGGQSH